MQCSEANLIQISSVLKIWENQMSRVQNWFLLMTMMKKYFFVISSSNIDLFDMVMTFDLKSNLWVFHFFRFQLYITFSLSHADKHTCKSETALKWRYSIQQIQNQTWGRNTVSGLLRLRKPNENSNGAATQSDWKNCDSYPWWWVYLNEF